MIKMETIQKILQQFDIFNTLKESELGVLSRQAVNKKMEKGEALVLQGDNWPYFFLVLDGELVADISLREEIIKEIRNQKPDVIVSCDPTNLFPAANRINHPDHRAAGQAVLDAVFPAAGNPAYQFDGEQRANKSHRVKEVWLTLTRQPNFEITLTPYLEKKINALLCHRSQVQESAEELHDRYMKLASVIGDNGVTEYIEKFLLIKLS